MNKNSIKTIETSGSKRIVAAALLASYICAISPVAAFAKESGASARAVERVFAKEEKSEVLISAKKGGTVTLGDASIEIPEGALKKDTKISITRLSKVEDTGESLCNAIPKSGGYRFLPAGTKFEKDVTITLPYSAKFDEKPGSLEDLYTYFFDTKYLSENGFTLWTVPNVNASDDFSTVLVEAVKESGTAEAGFGVVFCERQVNGKPFMMAALINANGFYTVGKIVDGVFSHVNGGWKSFNLINRGMGVKNQIEVSFDSNSRNFVLKLNGGVATEFAAQEEIAFKGSRSGFAVVVANNEKLPSNSVKVTFENKR